ncbi:hypothetical protein EVG20_g7653 [Dentipellis fragilis]|uniref:MYND-type domain-containing protein n=1 Tax=Dentipellis fragilis TaxID=205917 RepID=A0A4Y9YCR5_9AGAM|nr:hypothetical protein EVG20_g7653 [Dentipellis fragilis]
MPVPVSDDTLALVASSSQNVPRPSSPTRTVSRCAACNRELQLAEMRRCSGCKVIKYCGAECQVADWRNGHKQACRSYGIHADQQDIDHGRMLAFLAQRSPGASQKQLKDEEEALFDTWYAIHKLSIQKAAIAAFMNAAPRARVPEPNNELPDISSWLFTIGVRPRIPADPHAPLDPSTMFTMYLTEFNKLADPDVEGFADMAQNTYGMQHKERWELWAAQNQAPRALRTVVPYAVTYRWHLHFDGAPLFEPTEEARPVLLRRWKVPLAQRKYMDMWIPTFKAMVLRGHVLGPPDVRPDADMEVKVGRMVRDPDSNEWKWVPLGAEEARRAGYLEEPGVLG